MSIHHMRAAAVVLAAAVLLLGGVLAQSLHIEAAGSAVPPAQAEAGSAVTEQVQIYLPVVHRPSPDVADEVLIPAGEFLMGCDINNTAEPFCRRSESPLHSVYLDAYYIDKYEVTNARYRACVAAGGCQELEIKRSWTRRTYYDNPDFAEYPVVTVEWFEANAFCQWAGKRLPTEAEWEKAARGSSDTRKYPWGDSLPNCTLVNGKDCRGDTMQVGSHPDGASPYGVMDMSGNVWEWINDWYGEHYYEVSPSSNPPGPETGVYRSLRGGSWSATQDNTRVAHRSSGYKESRLYGTGFRCARTP